MCNWRIEVFKLSNVFGNVVGESRMSLLIITKMVLYSL